MMIKKILTFIVLLGFSLALMDIGLWAGTDGILPGTNAQQEKTEKKEEEKKEEEKKEEKKKKEEEKKLKRVWTDKDLKEIRKERLNITEVSPDPDEEKKKKKEKKEDLNPPDLVRDKTGGEKYDPKKTKKYWQDRKKALVERIQKNKEEIERLERRIPELRSMLEGTHINSPDRHSDRVKLINELEDSKKKLQNYKLGLARMQKELEDLYDEARRAGALPGWLRD